MKKILTFCIIILFIVSTSKSFAQFNAGIIGGVNVAKFHAENDEISSRILWGIGSVINYSFNYGFSIQAEPMYLKKGGIREQVDNDPKLTFDQDFLEIPILLKYSSGDASKVYLTAGPTIGFTLASEMDAEYNGITYSAEIKNLTEAIDIGLNFGGGLSAQVAPGELFFEIKYSLGLTNLAKDGKFTAKAGHVELEGELDSKESEYKSRGIQLLVGFTFPL